MLALLPEAQCIDLWEEESMKYELEHVEAKQSLCTARTHTQPRAHAHARRVTLPIAYACMQPRLRALSRTCTQAHETTVQRIPTGFCAIGRAPARAPALTLAHARTQPRTNARARACARGIARACARVHTRPRTHFPLIYTRTHRHARAQTRARGRAHSLTHTTAAQGGARRWSDG
jgi:hypothetical protein